MVRTTGPLPDGVLGEVRIHQQVYARRPEVGAICRIMPPQTGLLATLQATQLEEVFGPSFVGTGKQGFQCARQAACLLLTGACC